MVEDPDRHTRPMPPPDDADRPSPEPPKPLWPERPAPQDPRFATTTGPWPAPPPTPPRDQPPAPASGGPAPGAPDRGATQQWEQPPAPPAGGPASGGRAPGVPDRGATQQWDRPPPDGATSPLARYGEDRPAVDPWERTDWEDPDDAHPTTVIPPTVQPPGRWTGHAGVDPRHAAPANDWQDDEDPYHGRSWFTPVLIGVVGFVVLALVAGGIWLIYHNSNSTPAVVPSTTVTTTAPTAAPTTAAPTTAAPTSAAPSSAAPSDTGQAVAVIPHLHGDNLADATSQLQGLGFHVVTAQTDDTTVSPGDVSRTDPPEGSSVTVGSTITIYVANGPPTPTPTTPTPTASTM